MIFGDSSDMCLEIVKGCFLQISAFYIFFHAHVAIWLNLLYYKGAATHYDSLVRSLAIALYIGQS